MRKAPGCYIEIDMGRKAAHLGAVPYKACLTENQAKTIFGDDPENAELLGCGSFACAWAPKGKPERAVKITVDPDDVAAMERAQGLRHVAKIDRTWELLGASPGGAVRPLYAMSMERLDPPTEEEGFLLEHVFGNYITAADHDFYRYYGTHEGDLDGEPEYTLDPDLVDGVRMECEAWSEAYSFSPSELDRCERFGEGLVETLTDLGRRGINWRDAHAGNIGVDPNTDDWKILDLGLSASGTPPKAEMLRSPASAKRPRRPRRAAPSRHISGTFCREIQAPRRDFDRRSFRWIKRRETWILIGCPKGQWQPRKQRCKVGTRAYEVLTPATPGKRCKRGRRIEK